MIRSADADSKRDVDRRETAGVQPDGVGYFGFLALDYFVLRLHLVPLGVVRELLTIPMIVAVIWVFVFAVVRMLRDRWRATMDNVGFAAVPFTIRCLVWI